ncbi:MAG: alpha/beta hydrolase fold protein [Candidatus Angelobacter sp.]|jgi:pimeloyl-ACP methyl ester carboxylesterase|nr:alpha/beta hydrolase fold protein [Candidatus Angelobacter sp.]
MISKPPFRKIIPDGIEERWATVHGHRMRYLFGGSGPPLLLVHGLMGFSFSWSENLAVFAQHFTVYAPDLLNVGYSDRCNVDPSLQATAAEVVDFMDAVGLSAADVIGTSYGGTVAMMLAAIAPSRVQRLILVAPAHCGSEGVRWQSRLFSTRTGAIIAQSLYLAPAVIHGYFIKRMYAVPSRALPGTVKEYAAAIRIPGTITPLVKLMCCWNQNFKALAEAMPKIADTPVLIIWGDKDVVVPVTTMNELVAHFQNPSTAIIKTAGHLPYEELPEEFNLAVLDFLLIKVPHVREANVGNEMS